MISRGDAPRPSPHGISAAVLDSSAATKGASEDPAQVAAPPPPNERHSWGHKLTLSLAEYGRQWESVSSIIRPAASPPRRSGGDFHTTFSTLYPSMDFGESLWDERTPLEQVLSMGFCFGLFLLMTTATYLAYFATTYNMVNTKHVFGMEFDVCTKDVCIEQARFLQSTLNRSAEPCGHFYEYACHQWPKTMAATLADNASNVWTLLKRNVFMELDNAIGKARLKPSWNRTQAESSAVHFYLSCTNWTGRNALELSPLRDVLANLSVRYWPLLDVYGEEYNTSRLLKRVLLLYRLDVFVALRVRRSLRNRSQALLNIDNPSFGLPEGLLRFEYPEKAGVLDHYHDFIVRVARFFRTDVRLSTVAREIVQFEVNLAKTVEMFFSEKSFLWTSAVVKFTNIDTSTMIPWTWIIKDVARNAGISDLEGLEVVLWSKRYLDYLSHLFRQPVIRRHLINYVAWRVILALGPYTSEAFVAIQQDFLRRVGLASNAPRTELCLHDLWTWLPHAAGQLLFARSNQLAPNRKQVLRMCEELRATMAHNLDYSQWMTPNTRQHAISKAKGIKFVVAEQNPDLIENTNHSWSYLTDVVKLLLLRASNEWDKMMTHSAFFVNDVPQSSLEVHYDPIFNTVVIPGALLEPPLYTEGLSPAFNFGSLGFVVASKMMSSLIFEGLCFDRDGTYTCWWDTETVVNYTGSVESCYDDAMGNVNKTDINNYRKEMVTSMAAIGLSYKGFRLFMRKFEEEFEHSSLKNLDLTQNQLFFISFAMTWCENVPAELRHVFDLSTSTPSSQFRVETALRHFDKFGKYFACNDNQIMNPDKKCGVI